MPSLFIFLLKVNVALAVFCLGYYLVLRPLTFYTLNRLYLCIAILFSSLYPLINVNNFIQQHNIPVHNVVVNWQVPAENFIAPIIQQPDYWKWATILFWVGAAVFALRLIMQLASLYKIYKSSKPGNIQGHDVRIVNTAISPFSFWKSIFINPESLNPQDMKSILQHEQVHVEQWHTLDILLTEISVVFYWFNPGIWLMKRAVRENIEFITDRRILQNGADTKAYQYSLLNVSFTATTATGITNHFNFSTLKKRIQMMNAKRSSKVNLTRYAFLLPALVVCLFAFSVSKAQLVKKGKVVYKTIASTVNNLKPAATATEPAVVKAKKTTGAINVIDTTKKFKQVIITDIRDAGNGTDTSKKNLTFKIVRTNDSVSWYINGKKASKAEFESLKPDRIESLSVLKEDNPDAVVLVQTKGANNTSASTNLKRIRIITKDTVGHDPVSRVMVMSGPDDVDINSPHVFIKQLKDNNTSNIDNFSDKLIFIDEKEATAKDLKKLPASAIQRINVNAGKAMTDKYGDKAKNGVIFITTKKENK